ncbi:MAG: hypothetical protein E7667_04380 [Ruminococcaceae bacterium]|nr:hypothetical protein [Oscillospiraceae bacterium]
MAFTKDNPWIKEREANICTWKIDYNRGYISNMATSLLVDFSCMSNRQLADYAKMLKTCGFTGAQVTDMVTAWRASGSWEFVHDRYKVFADELHKLGMKFSLWVWAATFTGHGWVDDEVVYINEDPSKPAWKDSRVWATFNKYYDIYADMAPYTDRVIAHFFDPGELKDTESILKFTQLLADKFRGINPDVKIGIDTWGAPAEYPSELVRAGMKDIMLMELPFLPTWRAEGKRAEFRQGVKNLGVELGSWGWYTCDYEIDQMATMTVNNRVISHVFNETRKQADHVMVPSYWSELESYHLLNFFSMYAAGHLLTDPDANPDKLLRESAELMVGKGNSDNADKLMTVLEFIRDGRSGDTWESFWHAEGNFTLYCADYSSVFARADEAVANMEYLIAQPEPENAMPFPITRKALYKLILPHVHQIRQFARFRVDYESLKAALASGADKETLQSMVDAMDFEIPEYNCITGLWGQNECRAAYNILNSFCKQNGLVSPARNGAMKMIYKRRIIDFLCVCQRGLDYPVWVNHMFYEMGIPFGDEFGAELMRELIDDGVLITREDGLMALSNWSDYRFDFNI